MKFRTLISSVYFPLVFPCLFLIFISCTALAQTPVLDAEEQAFLKLINDYRAANGLGTLQVSVAITNACDWMSSDMATKNYFDHTDSLGRDPFVRMRAFGYNYNTWMGENIAAGYSDALNTFNQFKNSPPHNENMLNPNYKVMGISRFANPNSTYRYYWTTDFGGFVDAILAPPVATVNTVSAASYMANAAPDSLVSLFGTGLGVGVYGASNLPLPKSLGGTTVTVNGTAADLLYVSPTQINYLVPASTSAGTATVEVKTNNVVVGRGTVAVESVAPGIFTITSDGKGIPAGYSTFDNITLTPLFNPDGTSRPIGAGTAQRPDYLVLFGTGFRKRSSLSNVQVRIGGIIAQVDYAGQQASYVGLDQLNIMIPTGARGSGEVDVILTVDGRQANKVRVNIGN
ncbi:MAG: CAP domain-containing protein [Blastocatellia bacterium]